jgi:hypothetical protein
LRHDAIAAWDMMPSQLETWCHRSLKHEYAPGLNFYLFIVGCRILEIATWPWLQRCRKRLQRLRISWKVMHKSIGVLTNCGTKSCGWFQSESF